MTLDAEPAFSARANLDVLTIVFVRIVDESVLLSSTPANSLNCHLIRSTVFRSVPPLSCSPRSNSSGRALPSARRDKGGAAAGHPGVTAREPTGPR
jgi:hypothetical protein